MRALRLLATASSVLAIGFACTTRGALDAERTPAPTSEGGAGTAGGAGTGGSAGTGGVAGTGGGAGTGGDAWPDPPAGPRTFNHQHTDLAQIPASCIDAVKSANFVLHYAHRSHGSQITSGADSLEAADATYGFDQQWCALPNETGVLRVWDGMTSDNYVLADHYWATPAGVDELRAILNANPEIRYTSWAWSFEISGQTADQVQQYLETLGALEEEYPAVTFIYMTGTAQETYQGVNRAERNQQIRSFCEAHGKVLFDFEDLDSWWNGERHTEVVDSVEIPVEHPHYSLDTAGNSEYQWSHTTQESCENKARAFWWMMARLEGCTELDGASDP